MEHVPAKLLDHEVAAADSARNLGGLFNGTLNFKKNISHVCATITLGKSTACLASEVAKTVASKLEYCNGLLYNVTNREKFQGVQNGLVRVVSYFSRTTPLLKSLRWLQLSLRIKFKIYLVPYKAVCNDQPLYIKEMKKGTR